VQVLKMSNRGMKEPVGKTSATRNSATNEMDHFMHTKRALSA